MGSFHAWNRPQYLRKLTTATARAARTPVIQPKWVNTVQDHKITDCASIKNMSDINAPDSLDLLCLLKHRFNENGVVHMRNTNLTKDLTSMRAWALNIMGGEFNYTGGANYRGNIEGQENVYDTGAPGDAHIHYHHEMAYMGSTVSSLGLFCGAALPGGGGSTFLSDNLAATDALLATDTGKKLEEQGVIYNHALPERP